MTGPEIERTVRQSVLDRLIDHEPRLAADRPTTWRASVEALKESLLRDLEWLLNARRIVDPAPDACTEVQNSVYHFGLPDITSLNAESEAARLKLVRQVEACIRQFEPRLLGARAFIADEPELGRRQVRFIIEGVLNIEPNPERVVFDTVLETPTGKFVVGGAADA